jgi:hypothetical protein
MKRLDRRLTLVRQAGYSPVVFDLHDLSFGD